MAPKPYTPILEPRITCPLLTLGYGVKLPRIGAQYPQRRRRPICLPVHAPRPANGRRHYRTTVLSNMLAIRQPLPNRTTVLSNTSTKGGREGGRRTTGAGEGHSSEGGKFEDQ